MSRQSNARTARANAMIQDLETIRREAAWLIDHVADLDVIAHSKHHQERESVTTSHSAVTESPDLSGMWEPRLRNNMKAVERLLRRHRTEIMAARVGLEKSLRGGGADSELIGTELEPGELKRLREAKQRRDANQGDYRFGEWEATPERQPDSTFR